MIASEPLVPQLRVCCLSAAPFCYTEVMTRTKRPPFIVAAGSVPTQRHRYPQSDEYHGYSKPLGRAAGLLKIGVNLMRLPPGERSSWPHAEEKEEEFVYVLAGEVDAWINGTIHTMRPGDLAAFPAGTGITHCFINNSQDEALLLVGGEASRPDNRIYYPMHPQRRDQLPPGEWWEDVPRHRFGPHDGKPDAPGKRSRAPSKSARVRRK
jgi:uncharacterized cupin superfamily protein